MLKKIIFIFASLFICIIGTSTVYATELNEDNTVYIEKFYKVKKDSGFSKKIDIDKDDPHYGWKLGLFAITDFSSRKVDENGNYILLKNIDDKITLYFILNQDINKLDGNKGLKISEDKNGYDTEFGIKQTNFGKGFLIIREIEPSGKEKEIIKYSNYLKGVEVGANTKVEVFEEGDYEVALDYEILDDGFAFFNSYHNYRIRFNFSVRNGNCMIYPFDIETKNELKNTSITENGFYLDLANQKYLSVTIKKEVYSEGADGLVEDTRFNRPAKSGEEYTDEGIYTITAKNEYTNETTIKKIYVGTDKYLKAYVQNNGYTIAEIKSMVNEGAEIDKDGNILNMPEKYKKQSSYNNSNSEKELKIVSIIPIAVPVVIILVIVYIKIKSYKKEQKIIKRKMKENTKDKSENKEHEKAD